ncbi:MAG: glycosyltransferase family 39 protein [Prevotellaceae bacterium]|nr:glycosyltransferase family 39 protein [Prevotellaceae bacterium]
MKKWYIIIFIAGALLFTPFLGQVHLFDWDEINFAESAREMLETGDYNTVRIDFVPFWEKPPLFIWMQAASMKIFGINEFAARFPNALCGILTLLFLFHAGGRLYGQRFGLLWALSYAGSVLPFFYFQSGIIDPWFNLFIFAGIYFLMRFFAQETENQNCRKGHRYIILSAASIGLGIMTKGPVALLVWGLTALIYTICKKGRIPLKWYHIPEFILVLLLVGGSWFWGQIIAGNEQTVYDFISYQIRLFRTEDAGHGGFLMYHFVILFFGVFPASVFSLAGYGKNRWESNSQKNFKLMMILLLWLVLILFTIVKTKIVHYSSLCYFPLAFLSACALNSRLRNGTNIGKTLHVAMIIILGLLTLTVATLTNIRHFSDFIVERQLLNDPFALANLQAEAGWTGYECLIALIPLSIIFLIVRFYRRKQALHYAVSALAGICLFTLLTTVLVVGRVEAYSQRAAIEFFESKNSENCYLLTMYYKSYAQYFYGKTRHSMSEGMNRLQNGDNSVPVYVSTKNIYKDRILKEFPQLKILYEKNGFVFLQLEN